MLGASLSGAAAFWKEDSCVSTVPNVNPGFKNVPVLLFM